MNGLERLQRAGIPCIAVEGNHEHAYYSDFLGWVRFLAARDLLILLDPEVEEGRVQLQRYEKRKGSFIDPVPGLRVHGMRYYGASTAKMLEGYAAALSETSLDDIEYSIFVTHAGVEGVMPEEVGGLTYRQLTPIRPYCDYVALGHIHKPFEMEGWIHNPGSPETCSIMEANWPERGYYLVNVDTDGIDTEPQSKHVAKLCANPRRAFHRLSMKTDLYPSAEALYDSCREFLTRRGRDLGIKHEDPRVGPVVELQLTGVLPFERSALDLSHIESMVVEILQPVHTMVKNLTTSAEFAVEVGEVVSRPILERQVISDLFARDVRYRERSRRWASLALALKRLALDGASADAIIEELGSQMETISGAEPDQMSDGEVD